MVLSATVARPVRMRRREPRIIVAKTLVHLLALAPAAWLAWQIRAEVLLGSGALGADPVAAIEHFLGLWALRLLMFTLAITPLRQLTGKPVLLRFRRLLGLYVFFYATLHFGAWIVLDLRWDWSQIGAAIAKKPYVTVGFAAWLLLLALTATSFQRAMRALGRRWGQLHRAIYAIAVLAVLHFWWLVKFDVREPALYAAIATVLLGWRVLKRRRTPVSPRRTAATG
jgi:sulfoxide reductase heme-binding subunit YedZ